jgi:hypothetical protein
MTDIQGSDVTNAFDKAMDTTVPRMSTELGKLIHQVSFNSNSRMAGQTTTRRVGDVLESSANTYYWRWWLDGRGAIVPVRAKYLHFFVGGKEIFTKYVKPFKGHRDTVEPLYQKEAINVLDSQLTRHFGEL